MGLSASDDATKLVPLAALRACVPDAKPEIIGKPAPLLFMMACEILGITPDEAVMIGAESPNVIAEELSVKVMVCAVFTAKVCVTGVAGLNFAACPACEAVMEQVPIDLMVTVPVGVTVHTAAELLANDTGSLLEAVATRLYGATPRATSAGFVNVMVCAAAAIGVGIFCGTS
jgi:hypothetical protein